METKFFCFVHWLNETGLRQCVSDLIRCIGCDPILGRIISSENDISLLQECYDSLMKMHECEHSIPNEWMAGAYHYTKITEKMHENIPQLVNLIRNTVEYGRKSVSKYENKLRILYFNLASALHE